MSGYSLQVAPVLPPTTYGILILLIFTYSRYHPAGIFHASKWEELKDVQKKEKRGGREEEAKEMENLKGEGYSLEGQ